MSRPHALAKRNLPSPRLRCDSESKGAFFVPFIISIGIYFLSLCVISLVMSCFLLQKEDPARYVSLMSMIASVLSSLLSSAYLCRSTQKSKVLCGMIMSLTLIGLSLLFSLISKDQITQPMYKGLLLKLPLILSCLLGGAIGKKREKLGKRRIR